jgi:hypothetical protein
MELSFDQQMRPAVRIDLMRAALTAFYAVYQSGVKSWSGKARRAVSKAVKEDWRNEQSYLTRCFAFWHMTKGRFPKTLEKWLVLDENGEQILGDALIDAVAMAPTHHSKFRIKEFAATVGQLSR